VDLDQRKFLDLKPGTNPVLTDLHTIFPVNLSLMEFFGDSQSEHEASVLAEGIINSVGKNPGSLYPLLVWLWMVARDDLTAPTLLDCPSSAEANALKTQIRLKLSPAT